MSQQESLIFHSKDFFGDAVDATLEFYSGGSLVHSTRFQDGYVAIKMPLQLEPGVYDVVARRDESGEYRIDNLMISLASHYFSHSRLHDDLKLEGGNLKANEVIEGWKFDPMIHHYISFLPTNAYKILDDMTKYSSNPAGMRWGGQITLGSKVNVSKGAAVVDGNLIEWIEQDLTIPVEMGKYNLGIKNKQIVLTEDPVDYTMAIVYREGQDWVRMSVKSAYHPVSRGTKTYVFKEFEETTKDVELHMPSHEGLFGMVSNGKVFGPSRSTVPTNYAKAKMVGDGPVLHTDRLYVYATPNYFLLWEENTLLVALPRWVGSHIMLDWNNGGVVFASWGNDGHSRWESPIPYGESYVNFSTGRTPSPSTSNLSKTIIGFNEIAEHDFNDWDRSNRVATSTINWDGLNAQRNLLTYNDSTFEDSLPSYARPAWTIAERSTDYSDQGTYSLKLTTPLANETNDNYISRNHKVTPGKTYTFTFRFYVPVDTYISGYFMGPFHGSTGTRMYSNITASDSKIYTAGWHTLSYVTVIPSNYDHYQVRIHLRPPRVNDNTRYDSTKAMYIDYMQFEEGSVATTFVPGGQTLTPNQNLLNYVTSTGDQIDYDVVDGYYDTSISVSTDRAWEGSKSFKVDTTIQGGDGHFKHGIIITTDEVLKREEYFTFSAYIWMPSGIAFRLTDRIHDSDGKYVTEARQAINYVGTGQWQNIVLPFNNTNNALGSATHYLPGAQVQIDGSLQTIFYIDAMKIEKGSILTPFSTGIVPTPSNKNLLTYNQSTAEKDLTGFNNYHASTEMKLSKAVSLHGSKSLAIRVPQGAFSSLVDNAHGRIPVTLSPNTTYTWQIMVYCPAPTKIRRDWYGIEEGASPYTWIAFTSGNSVELPMGWTKLTGTGTTTSTWAGPSIIYLNPPLPDVGHPDNGDPWDTSKIIYYDKIMIEVGSTASAWSPGT